MLLREVAAGYPQHLAEPEIDIRRGQNTSRWFKSCHPDYRFGHIAKIRPKASGAMLPPEQITPTRVPSTSPRERAASEAANALAPLGSRTSLRCSAAARIATRTSSSVTLTALLSVRCKVGEGSAHVINLSTHKNASWVTLPLD